jgi:hypothetical protein
LSNTCYDPDLDNQIIEIIENNEGETRFNTLCDLLEKGPKIISRHLEFLTYDQKILEWGKSPHGKKGSIKLTTISKIKRKYGIFSIDYSNKRGLCSKWREQTEISKKSDRKRKLMLFLLLVLASGYMSYKNSSKGGIVIREGASNDPIATKTVAITEEPEYGFSPDDLIRDDYQLSTIHTSMRLNRFSREEAKDLLNEIREYKDIELKPISYNGHIKYKIKDETLQDFLIYCSNIITTLVQVMRVYFFFIKKQRQKEAIQWFYNILGDEAATMFFTKIDKNRAKKKSLEDLYIEFYQYDNQFPNEKDNKKFVDNIIQSCRKLDKELNKDFFTKKKLENRFLGKNNPNSLVYQLIMDSENINQRQEKYEHPKGGRYPFIQLKKKYPFLFDDGSSNELKNLVNPPFSQKWFKIDLFN